MVLHSYFLKKINVNQFIKALNLILITLSFFFTNCGISKNKLNYYAASETYPNDEFLLNVKEKRAMIVVAHDDDPSAMAGTLTKLKKEGWTIKQLCFTSGNQSRDSAMLVASKVFLDEIEFINIPPEKLRLDFDSTIIRYMPIPKSDFQFKFDLDKIHSLVLQSIDGFNPTVIFTLDNEIGGYGHPEHILLSQFVLNSFENKLIRTERIYQSVYTNSMEDKILKERLTKKVKKWGFPNSYMSALKMYNLNGMPEPNVQINIESSAEEKMNYLRTFNERERKTIGFYVPYFDNYNARKYFSVFNREFFKVYENTDSKN
jgi:LmbE family N-acetylglucosaminyl deacetylase